MPIISNSTIGSSSVVEPSAKGDLVTFSNAVVNLGIAPSVNGKVLTQKITDPTGLEWKSPVGSKAGLLSNDGTNTKELPVGTDNQVLTANGSATSGVGLEWKNATPLTTLGDIIIRGSSIPERLGIGTAGNILTSVSNKPSWQVNPVNALTTKGDILSSTGTAISKLGVGTDGQILTAKGSATSGVGLEWGTPSSSGQQSLHTNSQGTIMSDSLISEATSNLTALFFNQTPFESVTQANRLRVEIAVPKTGTLKTFRMFTNVLSGNGTWDIQVSKNGVASSGTEIFGNLNSGTDNNKFFSGLQNVSVNAGDLIALKILNAGNFGAISFSIRYLSFIYEHN